MVPSCFPLKKEGNCQDGNKLNGTWWGVVLAHRPSIWEIKARRFVSVQPGTYAARPCLETSNPNRIAMAALLKGTEVQRRWRGGSAWLPDTSPLSSNLGSYVECV